ncbi:ribonuclease III, partial [Acidobacteria bacterium AH-259-O06]|nr:ribonuclease III [Acidobacteria bacterium AH-259-O06]
MEYVFTNRSLLERALTHSSFAHEARIGLQEETPKDYEALEFLGDAILGFLIGEYLFRTHPSRTEGELSKMRSFLVSANHLASLSQKLDLGTFLRLGHGEEKTGGRKKRAILADLFESLVAAIYLDGGWEPTRRFLFSQFAASLEKIAQEKLNFQDRKSLLQEKLHDRGFPEPSYRVVDEVGPDHKKNFIIEVHVQGRFLAKASGKSKKEAE